MSKLLEDEKVAKLVEKETAKAVKADRKRILDGLKDLKQDTVDGAEDPKEARMQTKLFPAINKIVRETA